MRDAIALRAGLVISLIGLLVVLASTLDLVGVAVIGGGMAVALAGRSAGTMRDGRP